ncbi:MAG: patatin-like phospholipase family protein [Candidatus Rokuibacteriota bacterium]
MSRTVDRRVRTARVFALGLIWASFLGGCASAHYLPVLRADVIGGCEVQVPERELLLGVALSGGGSRAALFGAAGLEALAGVRTADGASLIDKIAHLSSVSGGSLAATYYTLKKPGRDVAVLDANGTLSDAYRAFFEQYRSDLSQDFETALIWRQLLSFRWVNSALAAQTLYEILAERLYGQVRFEDISAREKAGDSPGLIVNTTLYNNGRRLAVTSLPAAAFDYDFFEDLERSLQQRGRVMEPAPYIRERWKLLRPMTLIEIHIDPCRTLVAGAATASASFPPLIGPLTMKVGEEEAYWHAGDGGLYENSGIESLLLLYLKQHQVQRTKRALIIAFDSSYPFWVGERQLLRRSLPFSLLTFDFSRVPSIMEERATTYQALFFRSLQLEGVVPDSKTITVVVLRHTEAKWAADMSDLPPACKAEREPLQTPEAVRERIAEIPTRLTLPSECDRQLLVSAAGKLVAEHQRAILEFMNRP